MSRTISRAAKGLPLSAEDHDFNLKVLDLGHLSVKEFGAVGDGVTDDWAALEAVGNHLRTLPLEGTVHVHFPQGDYVCGADGETNTGQSAGRTAQAS